MKMTFLFASIIIASGLLLTNVYTSIVDAKSWGADIPNSIQTARDYYRAVNPGNFFRIFSPINQLLGLLALILFWKSSPSVRLYLGISFALYLVAEGLTFGYFYPRNDIMFKTASLTDVETLKRVVTEWQTMNWVRSLVLLVGIVCACVSVNKIYGMKM